MRDLIAEWCEAESAYSLAVRPGGLARYVIAHRLYHAGRALFDAVGVEAPEGRYAPNQYFERPSKQCQGLLDRKER